MADPIPLLGKKKVKLLRGLPALGKYTLSLPAAPPETKYSLALNNLGQMKNDELGICTIAAVGHSIQLWTSMTRADDEIVSDEAIIDMYSAACGYVRGDPYTDNGGIATDVLKYWYQHPLEGHSLSGFASIGPGNRASIRDAIYLFGVAYVGVQLPLSAQNGEWTRTADGPLTGNDAPGSWGGHAICLDAETPIPLLNGTEKAIKDLPSDTDSWVYSCSSDGRIVPGRARSLGCTGRDRELYRVTLDNGQSVRCTGDHLFMMRDGSYRKAQELKPGASLMPLYRKIANNKANPGYENCFNPQTSRWSFTHHLIASDRTKELTGLVVHHKDFDKRNNDPDNLVVMTWEDHTNFHAENARPELLLPYVKSEQGRERSRRNMQALWNEPEWRRKSLIRLSENGKKVSARLAAEGRLGTQAFDKARLREFGIAAARNNFRPLTKEEHIRHGETLKKRIAENPLLREKRAVMSRKNIAAAHEKFRENGPTEAQRAARRLNMKRISYERWHKDSYPSFEAYEKATNHKVVSVGRDGRGDVYDISVEQHHNFAVGAGVFVHNCIVDYDPDGLTCITWGKLKRMSWDWMDAYTDEAYALLSKDWIHESGRAPPGFDFDTLADDMKAIRGSS